MISVDHGVFAVKLSEFFEKIYIEERSLKSESERQLRMSIQLFNEFAGNIDLEEMSHKTLNRWTLENPRNWSPKTMRRRVADIISVWTYAYATETTNNRPDTIRIRRVRLPHRYPRAWTVADLSRICTAAESFKTFLPNGVRIGSFLRTVVYVGFYSALRVNDLYHFRRDQMSPLGQFVAQEKKHDSEVLVSIPQWVIDFVNTEYPSEIELVWAWPYSHEHFYAKWKECLSFAGLPVGRKEGLQKLRRSAVSYGEAVRVGYGAQLAGHAPTSRITYDHYADPRIVAQHRGNLLPDLRSVERRVDPRESA
jgi:integrase